MGEPSCRTRVLDFTIRCAFVVDATVALKVGFISPFVTTACNINHINAGRQASPEAGGRHERTLAAVACTRFFSSAPCPQLGGCDSSLPDGPSGLGELP